MDVILKSQTFEILREELNLRWFIGLRSPNDSMAFTDGDLRNSSLIELLETMVARREKISRSMSVVGEEVAKRNYRDVEILIEAIRATIVRLDVL